MLFRSNDTATTEIYTDYYTLSLHDALPIYAAVAQRRSAPTRREEVGPVIVTRVSAGCGIRQVHECDTRGSHHYVLGVRSRGRR